MNMLFLMNKTKDQIPWVSSHDLYWENKMYKRKRSIICPTVKIATRSLAPSVLENPDTFMKFTSHYYSYTTSILPSVKHLPLQSSQPTCTLSQRHFHPIAGLHRISPCLERPRIYGYFSILRSFSERFQSQSQSNMAPQLVSFPALRRRKIH